MIELILRVSAPAHVGGGSVDTVCTSERKLSLDSTLDDTQALERQVQAFKHLVSIQLEELLDDAVEAFREQAQLQGRDEEDNNSDGQDGQNQE